MEHQVSFDVSGKTLRGILHVPDKSNTRMPAIVLCHGFMGNKTGLHRIFVKAARTFKSAGYVVLRFDFSGCGDSDGNHEDITIDGQIKEVQAAVKFLHSYPFVKKDETFLIGLSMGGAVAALAASLEPAVAGLALWAPVARMFEDIRGIVGEAIFSKIESKGIGDYLGFELGYKFIRSLKNNHPLLAAKNFTKPVFVVHGTGDREISCKNAALYEKLREEVPAVTEVHYLGGADHTFSAPRWEQEVFNLTLEWLSECQLMKHRRESDCFQAAVLAG